MEIEEAKLGGAKDSAGRPVSKLLVSFSHAVAKDHHGSFTYEVPNGDQIHCADPCFVGVSDLQVPVLGPAMANVVQGVNDKLYIYVAQSGSSNPNLSFHIITIPRLFGTNILYQPTPHVSQYRYTALLSSNRGSARPVAMRCQSKIEAIEALIKVAKNPPRSATGPNLAKSCRLDGASPPIPPNRMATEPRFAKPVRANVTTICV